MRPRAGSAGIQHRRTPPKTRLCCPVFVDVFYMTKASMLSDNRILIAVHFLGRKTHFGVETPIIEGKADRLQSDPPPRQVVVCPKKQFRSSSAESREPRAERLERRAPRATGAASKNEWTDQQPIRSKRSKDGTDQSASFNRASKMQ